MINSDEHRWIVEKYKPVLNDYKKFKCPYCDFNYINVYHIAYNFCPNCGKRMVFKKSEAEE